MRILLIHSDFIEYEPKKKAIPAAEEVEKKPVKVDEALVVFTAVEKGDEKNPKAAAKNAVKEIEEVFKEVKAENILIYPYAHLSSSLASVGPALKALKEMEKLLKEKNYSVFRAPFGWYKGFEIKCKGHPLSELSKQILVTEKPEELVSESLKQEEKVKSFWYILDPEGKLHEIKIENGKVKGFDFSKYKNLEKFALYEMAKSREYKKEPPHIKLMKRLELIDYEPGSDPGNFRFYPKGRLIKALMEQWVSEKVAKYGAMEVETPVMYDFEHPALKDYLNRFPARQYIVESTKKKYFLRFSACFGQFLMKSSMTISYKDLPLKMYELTRYSFRLEKSGELAGIKRLRAFTMPDMHTLCKDLSDAKREFTNQFKLSMECMKDMGFELEDYETAIRFTQEFWKENQEFVKSLVKLVNKPVLIEMWNFRYAYFDPKFEFNIIDALDKASALSTVQIDHENAQRYGVTYVDEKGEKKYPKILHCSPSGSLERCIYAILEKGYLKSKEGKNPTFPLWLSPTQIRLIPVSENFLENVEKIAEEIEKENIRVDIDDRSERVERKIRDAELEWVPLIVVVGEKELKSEKLAVRFRESGEVKNMSKEELIKFVKEKIKNYPFRSLCLPKMLSKRPKFVGAI